MWTAKCATTQDWQKFAPNCSLYTLHRTPDAKKPSSSAKITICILSNATPTSLAATLHYQHTTEATQLDTITIPLSRQETAIVLSSQQQMALPLLHKKLKTTRSIHSGLKCTHQCSLKNCK